VRIVAALALELQLQLLDPETQLLDGLRTLPPLICVCSRRQ
jgi:hypothetical protein